MLKSKKTSSMRSLGVLTERALLLSRRQGKIMDAKKNDITTVPVMIINVCTGFCRNANIRKAKGASVGDGEGNLVQVGDSVPDEVGNGATGAVDGAGVVLGDKVRNEVGTRVCGEVRNGAGDDMSDEVGTRVCGEVRNGAGDDVGDEVVKKVGNKEDNGVGVVVESSANLHPATEVHKTDVSPTILFPPVAANKETKLSKKGRRNTISNTFKNSLIVTYTP